MKKDVFEELFREHYNAAVLYTNALCRDFALAEDIVSNAFYKALISHDDTATFRYWLLRVCKNAVVDAASKKKRIVKLTEDIADGYDAAEEFILSDEYRALYRAIELLSDEYRETITLFYFEELSVREIALLTEKTEENVKVILYRARKKLKALLEAKSEAKNEI